VKGRVLRVLAVALAILVALRVRRVARLLAVPGLIGAIVVVGGSCSPQSSPQLMH
jgi:hypothetical protein